MATANMRLILHSLEQEAFDPSHKNGDVQVMAGGGVRIDVTLQGADIDNVERVRQAIALFMDFRLGAGNWAGPGTGADTVKE